MGVLNPVTHEPCFFQMTVQIHYCFQVTIIEPHCCSKVQSELHLCSLGVNVHPTCRARQRIFLQHVTIFAGRLHVLRKPLADLLFVAYLENWFIDAAAASLSISNRLLRTHIECMLHIRMIFFLVFTLISLFIYYAFSNLTFIHSRLYSLERSLNRPCL